MPINKHWDQRTLLIFQQATEIVGGSGEGLLVLTDTNELQQLVIPVDKKTLDWFRTWKKDNPNRERHLPDILVSVLKTERIALEIDIDDIFRGSYQAMLTNSQTLEQYPIFIVDALKLNRISNGTIPILIDNGLFLRQASPYDKKMNGVAMPLNALSEMMLEKAMKDSVDNENYELAAQIQEEMKRRKRAKEQGLDKDKEET